MVALQLIMMASWKATAKLRGELGAKSAELRGDVVWRPEDLDMDSFRMTCLDF